MAVTLTIADLAAAVRLGDSAEELKEVTRLHAYVSEAVDKYAPDAPATTANEAAVRLAAQLFDQPTASRGGYANALRVSGAARILMPYRIHRAGSTADAVAVAQGAVGTTGNPVIDVAVSGAEIVVTFADGSTESHDLAAAGVFGTDQDARDAAEAAQTEIDDHESNHPSSYTNQDARDAARSVIFDWAEQDNGSDIPESKTQRKIFLTTSPINGNTDPGTRSKLHDVHLYVEDTEWQVYEHTGTAPPYLVLRSRLTETAVAVQALINTHAAMPNVHHAPGGGPSLLGSYTGTLSNTAWTVTTLTPTAGKAMVGVVYVGANTHNSFTWNGWVMGWYPRGRFDSTNAADGAWRYNFRSTGSQLIYVGRAANGNVQIRVNGVQAETFEFEFWEL